MESTLTDALRAPGPHTAASLAERLPFPEAVVREALEALTLQGVLVREDSPGGEPQYRYLDPDRYHQINLDVIRDPGTGIKRRPR